MTNTMHAIRQYEFGPAENLRYEQVPVPDPGEGQVRIAVEAAGVHLIDTAIRQGRPGGPFPLPPLPMTPGREVAGVVEAMGRGVDPQWLGKRVVVHLGQASGGYAERVVATAASLHEVPSGLSAEQAVAMIGTGRTAMVVLDVAKVAAADAVLVTSAAGGLGTLLVQAARAAGAFVVGVAGGPSKVDLVRRVGAHAAVDYRAGDWSRRVREELGGRELTVVLDGVGGGVGRGALELLSPGGRIVLFGWSSGEQTAITTADLYGRGLTASTAVGMHLLKRYAGGIREVETRALAAAARGELSPLTQPFPLAKAAEAHAALETRGTTGKVVLVP